MSDIQPKAQSNFEKLLLRRINGEPVQYILGQWDFCGLPFYVGDGVLIPRPETEILARRAIEIAREIQTPVVVDLCAGTGCIGLTVAKNIPNAKVYLVEKSPEAFTYLKRNQESLNTQNAILIQGDILTDAFSQIPKCNLILSNPPYIPKNELPALQREVQREPAMALEGGIDGLLFYRAIAEKWAKHVKPGGVILLELGDGQYKDVSPMFLTQGFNVKAIPDDAGHLRVLEALQNTIPQQL